ncbi:MFS transporter [Frankia sp. AgPm24]|nr:MFS transporter [Frankia sp. AgPm24]
MLVAGQAVSVLGTQMTTVAVSYQVYTLTGSSLEVGLVSLAALGPLLAGALIGGTIVDYADRRRLLVAVSAVMAALSAGLALNASSRPALWPLFVCPVLAGGLGTFEDSAIGAVVSNLVRRRDVPAASALFQAVFHVGLIVGPALAGLLLAGAGVRFVYWTDTATFAAAALAALAISPQPPTGDGQRPGLRSLAQGIRFVRGRQVIQGALLIDLGATVFGLPRALFPALATTVFGGGGATVGLLYAAPGVGALVGALTTGWVSRVQRQGRAVAVSVIVWGLAIAGFGLVTWLPAALALLAVAGWADVISAVFRSTILQLSTPDALRGRLTGLQISVVTGGPRLGDLEAGTVASVLGDATSVVSGGLACTATALLLFVFLPDFRRQHRELPLVGPTQADIRKPVTRTTDLPG